MTSQYADMNTQTNTEFSSSKKNIKTGIAVRAIFSPTFSYSFLKEFFLEY